VQDYWGQAREDMYGCAGRASQEVCPWRDARGGTSDCLRL